MNTPLNAHTTLYPIKSVPTLSNYPECFFLFLFVKVDHIISVHSSLYVYQSQFGHMHNVETKLPL